MSSAPIFDALLAQHPSLTIEVYSLVTWCGTVVHESVVWS